MDDEAPAAAMLPARQHQNGRRRVDRPARGVLEPGGGVSGEYSDALDAEECRAGPQRQVRFEGGRGVHVGKLPPEPGAPQPPGRDQARGDGLGATKRPGHVDRHGPTDDCGSLAVPLIIESVRSGS